MRGQNSEVTVCCENEKAIDRQCCEHLYTVFRSFTALNNKMIWSVILGFKGFLTVLNCYRMSVSQIIFSDI